MIKYESTGLGPVLSGAVSTRKLKIKKIGKYKNDKNYKNIGFSYKCDF